AVLTTVGDSKQRIMLFAGAMPNVFETYLSEFQAETHYLTSNYRSVPELVRIQHVIAQIVESWTPPVTAAKTDSSGGCTILEFSNSEDEANHLATLIEQSLNKGLKPRDFCILVRQKTPDMIRILQDILKKRGIKLRDESNLQDLLTEPVVEFLLAILRLSTRQRDAEAWETLTNKVALLYGLDTDDDAVKIEQESKKLLRHAKDKFDVEIAIKSLPAELVSVVGSARFHSVYRQYGNGEYLDKTVGRLAAELQSAMEANDSAYKEAIDDLIGVDAIPAITIHKSKGLEFHTIIFLGLEDSQLWNFSKQSDEEKRGFFVAFSRAIEQVYFTFSDVRNGRSNARTQINELYSTLQQAGVDTENHRPVEV
ncbi:MAG: 3'-5' exonuclease, partial [Acidobacteriota bacterium]